MALLTAPRTERERRSVGVLEDEVREDEVRRMKSGG